ncbi:MAG: hypothetical protein IIC11_01555 [Proteobacteria bacterium]|nr:hypothetical protein [Pseudomonadota bacterium]
MHTMFRQIDVVLNRRSNLFGQRPLFWLSFKRPMIIVLYRHYVTVQHRDKAHFKRVALGNYHS